MVAVVATAAAKMEASQLDLLSKLCPLFKSLLLAPLWIGKARLLRQRETKLVHEGAPVEFTSNNRGGGSKIGRAARV